MLEDVIIKLYGPKEGHHEQTRPAQLAPPDDRARAIELEWYAHPRPSPAPRRD